MTVDDRAAASRHMGLHARPYAYLEVGRPEFDGPQFGGPQFAGPEFGGLQFAGPQLTDLETVETHSATLYFSGDRVYKVKKPLDLGFLDFRTREAREAACRAEVELNRRLAPDVYLGVADIRNSNGVLLDHMVVMRRMPANRRLSTMITMGRRVDGQLRALARLLAAFHERCATSPEIAQAGSLATLDALWRESLTGLAPFRGTLIDADVVDEIGRLALRYLAGRAPLLAERQRAGRIRDGHGDLLADDIYCLDDGPRVLDCIEFDRRLRLGDVLGDVAFLAMDLERLDVPEAAEKFLSWYGEFSAETHPPSLQHLYIAYRALVRAKVSCIRARQGAPDAARQARKLAAIALGHLRRGRVRLVLVGGLPGTGKSTLAGKLADTEDGWVLLRSDAVRKELAGLPAGARVPAGLFEGHYDAQATDATYAELLRRARHALERGENVVLDASWSTAAYRTAAASLAEQTATDLVELRCVTSPEVAAARIARRAAAGEDPSDATLAVHQALAARAQPWPTAGVIQTAVPISEALLAAQRHVNAVYR